jgi:hypothetical protein
MNNVVQVFKEIQKLQDFTIAQINTNSNGSASDVVNGNGNGNSRTSKK